MDTVLLASACTAVVGEKVLDMGCGVGGAGLCLLSRVGGLSCDGFQRVLRPSFGIFAMDAFANDMGAYRHRGCHRQLLPCTSSLV